MTGRDVEAALAAAALAVIITTVCGVVAESSDTAVSDAREALQYLDGHLPDGKRLPDGFAGPGAYVLACENRELDPRAVSATGDYGVWQINAYWQRERLARMGMTVDDLFDPIKNTVVAIAIWEDAQRYHGFGFLPWSCRKAIR